MQRIGCGIWLLLLLGLPLFGILSAIRHKTFTPIGAAWGIATWLALLSGYIVALSIVDWMDRKKNPDRIGVPKWLIPAAWCVSIAATVTSVVLFQGLHGP